MTTVIQWISHVINSVMTALCMSLSAGTSNVGDNNANFHGNKLTLKVIKSHFKGHIINRILHSK